MLRLLMNTFWMAGLRSRWGLADGNEATGSSAEDELPPALLNPFAGPKKNTFVFVHILKTGGTTFAFSYIPGLCRSDQYVRLSGIFPQHDDDYEELISLPDERKNEIRIIAGHNTYGLHEHFKKVVYITAVRDPIEIAISQYFHALFHDAPLFGDPTTSVPEYMRKNKVSLARFVKDDLPVRIYGDQCFSICNPVLNALTLADETPPADYSDEYLKGVMQRVRFTGVTKSLDLFLFSLHVRMGFPLVLYNNRLVRSRNQYASVEVTDSDRGIIADANDVDLRLYRMIEARFDEEMNNMLADKSTQWKWTAYKAMLEEFRRTTKGGLNKTLSMDMRLHVTWDS